MIFLMRILFTNSTKRKTEGGAGMMDRKGAARIKIINTACKLFNKRGVHGIGLKEISRALRVELPIVRSYFQSVDEIIELIVEPVYGEIAVILISFLKSDLARLYHDKKLEILSDRLRFADKAALYEFCDELMEYLYAVLDYFIVNRMKLRIIMMLSLTEGKRSDGVSRIHDLFIPSAINPVFASEEAIAMSFRLPNKTTQAMIHTVIAPLIYYAIYTDKRALSKHADKAARKLLLAEIRAAIDCHIEKSEIIY